jgi:hypothetical protein
MHHGWLVVWVCFLDLGRFREEKCCFPECLDRVSRGVRCAGKEEMGVFELPMRTDRAPRVLLVPFLDVTDKMDQEGKL